MTVEEAIERLVTLAKDAQYQVVCANSCQTEHDRRKADEAENALEAHRDWCLSHLVGGQ